MASRNTLLANHAYRARLSKVFDMKSSLTGEPNAMCTYDQQLISHVLFLTTRRVNGDYMCIGIILGLSCGPGIEGNGSSIHDCRLILGDLSKSEEIPILARTRGLDQTYR